MKHLKEKMENNVFEKQVFGIVEIKQIKEKITKPRCAWGMVGGFFKIFGTCKEK